MTPTNIIETQIGTDIKFDVKLVGEDLAHYIYILSVEAYFINTSIKEKQEYERKHFKFLRRYPVEPLVNDFISTAYCLNNSGRYGYNSHPYNGYGVEPFGKDQTPVAQDDGSICKARIFYTVDKSTVQVYFPADIQKQLGTYDFVIYVKVFDPDYAFGHVRTLSISYEGLVVLTERSEALPDSISNIVIDDEQHIGPVVTDMFVYKGALEGDNLGLTLTDQTPVSIDMSREFAWNNADLNR